MQLHLRRFVEVCVADTALYSLFVCVRLRVLISLLFVLLLLRLLRRYGSSVFSLLVSVCFGLLLLKIFLSILGSRTFAPILLLLICFLRLQRLFFLLFCLFILVDFGRNVKGKHMSSAILMINQILVRLKRFAALFTLATL
jgi:hypothetical protein